MNTKIKSFLTLVVAIILIGAALSFVQGKMNAIRYTEKLTDTDPLENAPPAVAFTSVALGGFRGLVADYLWLRSSKMQDEGNYFEMVQLADWIVKLQPRYTTSHAFLAWNMAYNVSVTFTGFEDRWRWVKRGIELIRDEALEYNPGDPELFRQLGWIYQHKMGQDLDDANRFYKTEFAKEMIRLFGSYYGKWDLIDKAPTNEAKLRAAIGDKDFNALKKACAKYSYATFNDLEDSFRTHAVLYPVEFKKELEEIGIADQVELCLRSRWIIRKYRLERGKDKWSTERDNERYFKKLSCDRMIFQSLQAAFESGRLVYVKNADPDNMYSDIKFLEMTPNVSLVDAANACYKEAMEGFNEYTVKGAYGNFLENAIVTLFLFGEKKKATEYIKMARTLPHYGVGATFCSFCFRRCSPLSLHLRPCRPIIQNAARFRHGTRCAKHRSTWRNASSTTASPPNSRKILNACFRNPERNSFRKQARSRRHKSNNIIIITHLQNRRFRRRLV